MKTSVVQVADICLFTTATYTCEVARLESSDGCPVEPGSTLSKVYTLCPLLANNKDKRGLALDGKLKYEDTNLASSTIMAEGMQAENLGKWCTLVNSWVYFCGVAGRYNIQK